MSCGHGKMTTRSSIFSRHWRANERDIYAVTYSEYEYMRETKFQKINLSSRTLMEISHYGKLMCALRIFSSRRSDGRISYCAGCSRHSSMVYRSFI